MIIINLDAVLARQKMSSGELAARVGITPANLSILKTGKAKAIRFSTLEAICRALQCQPGDVLAFRDGDDPPGPGADAPIAPESVPAPQPNPPDAPEGLRAMAHFLRAMGEPPPREGESAEEALLRTINESMRLREGEDELRGG